MKVSKIVKPFNIKYADFFSGKDLTEQLFESLNPYGNGIISVSGIPDFQFQRKALLKQARDLYRLPFELKKKLNSPESSYRLGLSQGQEVYKGQTNDSQSVFYANYYEQEESNYPFPNLWPGPELPNFKTAHKALDKTLYTTSLLVLEHLDKVLIKHGLSISLKQAILESLHPYSVLLHYLPQNAQREWSRWHCDHDIIGALCYPLYINEITGEQIQGQDMNWETNLYSRTKDNEIFKINWNPDDMLFFIGEVTQIITGGILRSTPHFVYTDGSQGSMSRNTFGLFLDPQPGYRLDSPNTKFSEFALLEYSGMPKLKQRWKNGATFLEFSSDAFS